MSTKISHDSEKPSDSSSSNPTSDLGLINDIIGHRMKQGDIAHILENLNSQDRHHFTDHIAHLLRNTSALIEVSRRLSESLKLDVLLPRMVETISNFLGAERCSIFLYDRDSDELFSRVAQGEGIQEIRFPASRGIAGYVFVSSQSLNIPDAYADSRFNPEIDKRTGYKTNNILCVPIRNSENETVGVIQVLNKEGGFGDIDINLLLSIAEHAASAFANAQLHEQVAKAREQEAQFLEVTNAISQELKLGPLLRRVMDAVTTILDADRSTLFLIDTKTNELWSHVAQGIGIAEIRFPSHLGIAGSVFTSGITINIPDAYADDRFNPSVDKKTGYRTRSILCMPVFTKTGETVGVIQVLNKKGGPFRGIDEDRLRAFSSHISIAIENAKLFEEVVSVKNYNESILQSMSNGVVTFDAEGVVVKANCAAAQLFGATDEQVEDPLPLISLVVDDDRNDWLKESVERVMKLGESDVAMDTDLWVPTHVGAKDFAPMSVNVSVVPLAETNEANMGCLMLVEDITVEKRLRGTMARYMTKELADKLLEEGENVLGGTLQKASVFFSDIREFTAISEDLGAQETVAMLNEYFSIMVDIILERGGILDKYIGDAMMAVFGVPFTQDEDADNAVRAGIAMLQALQKLNHERALRGVPPIKVGIGINTDFIVSGNIGSIKRMDYTVIGDGVNLAARLESATKYYYSPLLMSEFTVRDLKNEYLIRDVDRLRVKGKSEPVGVYAVMDYRTDLTHEELVQLLELHHQGLSCYRNMKWSSAVAYFQQLLDLFPCDQLSQLYIDRCHHFEKNPPQADWDGVWILQSK